MIQKVFARDNKSLDVVVTLLWYKKWLIAKEIKILSTLAIWKLRFSRLSSWFFLLPIQPLFCHIRHRLNISQDGFMELFYLARSVIFGSTQREDWVLNKICQDISNPAHWLIIQWCYLQEIWFQRKINQCLWQPLLLFCIEHLQDVLYILFSIL